MLLNHIHLQSKFIFSLHLFLLGVEEKFRKINNCAILSNKYLHIPNSNTPYNSHYHRKYHYCARQHQTTNIGIIKLTKNVWRYLLYRQPQFSIFNFFIFHPLVNKRIFAWFLMYVYNFVVIRKSKKYNKTNKIIILSCITFEITHTRIVTWLLNPCKPTINFNFPSFLWKIIKFIAKRNPANNGTVQSNRYAIIMMKLSSW